MKILIGYSVYGKHPKYVYGAIANARARHLYYQLSFGVQQVFWLANDVPAWLGPLLSDERALVKCASLPSLPHPRFARLLTADMDCDVFFIRDVDSRPSDRELKAMSAFLKSSHTFHCMRDHPHHHDPVLTGMWGGMHVAFKHDKMWDRILRWGAKNKFEAYDIYGKDQKFLAAEVWPQMLQLGVLQHDTFSQFEGSIPFPDGDGGPDFVGEIVDEFGRPRQDDRNIREQALKERVSA
jgi:hypothetical protein